MDPSIAQALGELKSELESLSQRCSQWERPSLSGPPRQSPCRPAPSVLQQNPEVAAVRRDINTITAKFNKLEALLSSSWRPPVSSPHSPGQLEKHGLQAEKPAATAQVASAPPQSSAQAVSTQSPRSEVLAAAAQVSTTQVAAISLDKKATFDDPGSESFSLKLSDMGERLTGHLAAFARDTAFRGVVRIEEPPFDWDALRQEIQKPSHNAVSTFVTWSRDDKGLDQVARLRILASPLPKWELPDLSRRRRLSLRPSYDAAIAFLDRIARNPPPDPIAYYVGPPLAPSHFSSLLDPGDKLRQLPSLPGINTPYWHLGERASGTPLHREDANWRSYNFVVGPGWKLWVVIDKNDNAKLLDFIGRHWKLGDCAQAVRHLDLFIAPTRLEKEKIGFRVYCVGEGEMFVSQPDEYHYVVNWDRCLALAINHLHDDEPIFPQRLKVCRECGIFPLAHSSFEEVPSPLSDTEQRNRKRKSQFTLPRSDPKRSRDDAVSPKSMQSRSYSKAKALLAAAGKEFRESDPLCNIPPYPNDTLPSSEVFTYSCALRSRYAVRQLLGLIASHRELSTSYMTRRDQIGYVEAIRHTQMGINLASLQLRLYKSELFDLVNPKKKGRQRAEAGLRQEKLTEIGCSQCTYHRYRNEGAIWSGAPGHLRGLICLVPFQKTAPFERSPKEYIEFKQADRDTLHGLLQDDYMEKLCSAACGFLDSLWEGSHPVEFRHETSSVDLLTCEEEDMLRLLQPFPFTDINVWEPSKFPKPPNWPSTWPWPVNPTATLEGEKHCDYCDDDLCKCPNSAVGLSPLIKKYKDVRGIQAVAKTAGAVAYEKGSFLGAVTGELLPLHTFSDHDWTFDFTRPDLASSAVCQVSVGSVGNCFRLLMSAENPTALLVTRRRAGRWVLAVEAARDIRDKEPITVHSLPWRRPVDSVRA